MELIVYYSSKKEKHKTLDCIKQGETTEGEQKTLMGEILKVWMK